MEKSKKKFFIIDNRHYTKEELNNLTNGWKYNIKLEQLEKGLDLEDFTEEIYKGFELAFKNQELNFSGASEKLRELGKNGFFKLGNFTYQERF